MDLIDILLLTIGWLLISCAIARVLGGASDLGNAPLAQMNDTVTVSTSPRLTDEDYCLGLVLECEASPEPVFFPALIRHLSRLSKAAIPPARAAQSASRQIMPEQVVVPDLRLTPAR